MKADSCSYIYRVTAFSGEFSGDLFCVSMVLAVQINRISGRVHFICELVALSESE